MFYHYIGTGIAKFVLRSLIPESNSKFDMRSLVPESKSNKVASRNGFASTSHYHRRPAPLSRDKNNISTHPQFTSPLLHPKSATATQTLSSRIMQCPKCGLTPFDSWMALENHKRRCKGPLRPLQCQKCGSTDFNNFLSLFKHEETCNGAKRAAHLDYGLKEAKRNKSLLGEHKFPVDTLHDSGMTKISHLQQRSSAPDPDFDFGGGENTSDFLDDDESGDNSTKVPYRSNVALAPHNQFQIELLKRLSRHRLDLGVYDEFIGLLKDYSSGDKLKFSTDDLYSRSRMIPKLETVFETTPMKPKQVNVQQNGGTTATVACFDVEAMILSILNDENLMKTENLAPGYEFLTGKSDSEDGPKLYSEFHTGKMWAHALDRFCVGDDDTPLAMVVFGDKSHFDKHGTLATTPLIFTLTCFNQEARKRVEFWRPLGYIPNLGYGKTKHTGEEDREKAIRNLEDEHACLKAVLVSIKQLHKRGGVPFVWDGQKRIGKVWIHIIIGDTSGNNRWLAHYNAPGKLSRPYRDCKCSYDDMARTNPECNYITLAEMKTSKEQAKSLGKTQKKKAESKMSKHFVDNAFVDPDVPVSDAVRGVYGITPPELLHTTQEGITKYVTGAISKLLSKGNKQLAGKARELIEKLHHTLHSERGRNSERDFPRSSDRTGLFELTLVQAHERRGNLFVLLCISHCRDAKLYFVDALRNVGVDPKDFFRSLKLYLSMEEWFHDNNPVEEVDASRVLIAEVLGLIQKVYIRNDGQKWNIPKMHGLTKMQHYITLFGSGINFFGGPGESFHKKFVKDTGNNTQKRVDEFNTQISTRCYERMVLDHAMQVHEKNQSANFTPQKAHLKNGEQYEMEGSYWMQFKDMNGEELTQGLIDGPWKANGKSKSPSNFKLGLA